jgi:predicted nuclease of predicted toxin-antitoxin system
MKFLVDAHLPRRLCTILAQHGHDAKHTLDLAEQNATKDPVINQLSVDDQRVVVSKDTDFFYSHLLQGRPWKLLLMKTGNISTRDLRDLFQRNLSAIEAAFQTHTLVEIDRSAVTPIT